MAHTVGDVGAGAFDKFGDVTPGPLDKSTNQNTGTVSRDKQLTNQNTGPLDKFGEPPEAKKPSKKTKKIKTVAKKLAEGVNQNKVEDAKRKKSSNEKSYHSGRYKYRQFDFDSLIICF